MILEVDDREVYSITVLVDGRTKAPGGHVERLVSSPVTTRSWNTVRRVVTKELARA